MEVLVTTSTEVFELLLLSLNYWRNIRMILLHQESSYWGFPGGTVVESLPANAGDTGLSPGLVRSHMPRNNWAREPQLLSLRVWSLCSATREAAIVRGPRTAMKSGPRLPQLETALTQKWRPNTAIKKKKKNLAIVSWLFIFFCKLRKIVIFSPKSVTIHFFIQKMFIECLLCAGPLPKHWRCSTKQNKALALVDFMCWGEEIHKQE